MTITREEVLANRKKWIARLKRPESEKLEGLLGTPNNLNAMCCLGHGCMALGVEYKEDSSGILPTLYFDGNDIVAPESFVHMAGLYGNCGELSNRDTLEMVKGKAHTDALSALNDYTDATPQDIGAYLETVIEGGPDTPLRPLSDYEASNE